MIQVFASINASIWVCLKITQKTCQRLSFRFRFEQQKMESSQDPFQRLGSICRDELGELPAVRLRVPVPTPKQKTTPHPMSWVVYITQTVTKAVGCTKTKNTSHALGFFSQKTHCPLISAPEPTGRRQSRPRPAPPAAAHGSRCGPGGRPPPGDPPQGGRRRRSRLPETLSWNICNLSR